MRSGISSVDMRNGSVVWSRQSSRSSLRGVSGIGFSCPELKREQLLDAMNARGDIGRRKPGDVADRSRVQAFEIQQDHFALEGPQAVNERVELVESPSSIEDLVGITAGLDRRR